MKAAFLIAYDGSSPYQRSLPPLGIGYLAACAKRECWWLELTFHHRAEDLIAEKPDVAAVSSSTENFMQARADARKIKEELGIPVILGGMHITSPPHALPPEFDAGCIGEGELTFVDLMKLYHAVKRPAPADFAKIPGIVYHAEGPAKDGAAAKSGAANISAAVMTPPREPIENLDILPWPDRDLIHTGWALAPRSEVHLITSRGCPYRCSFCSSAKHWKKFRFFSAEYVAREIEGLRNRYNPELIYFFDDLFVGHAERWRDVVRIFRERGLHRGVRFRAYARADIITEEMAAEFAELNFKYIDFGFESNSEKILKYLGKSRVTPAVNQRAVDCLAREHLSIGANFILGSGPETLADAEETYQFVLHNKDAFDRCSAGPLQPLPGTAIWEEALAKGIVFEDMDWSRLGVTFETFDFARFPFLGEAMTHEEFMAFWRRFQQLAKEIDYVGQIRRLTDQKGLAELRIRELEGELARLRGSRAVRAALRLRDWRGGRASPIKG